MGIWCHFGALNHAEVTLASITRSRPASNADPHTRPLPMFLRKAMGRATRTRIVCGIARFSDQLGFRSSPAARTFCRVSLMKCVATAQADCLAQLPGGPRRENKRFEPTPWALS